jgi:hypothetical protein
MILLLKVVFPGGREVRSLVRPYPTNISFDFEKPVLLVIILGETAFETTGDFVSRPFDLQTPDRRRFPTIKRVHRIEEDI